jgi:predicted ATPase
MLKQISLEYFKCFEKLHLPLSNLTLLSGANATGKSTILQALAILNQTSAESEWNKSLLINASAIKLGTASDIIDQISGRNQFKIGLKTEYCECRWMMESEDRLSLTIPIIEFNWSEAEKWKKINLSIQNKNVKLHHLFPSNIISRSQNAKKLSDLISNLTYLSADRLGPQETYIVSTPELHKTVGSRGERTAWIIEHKDNYKPLKKLLLEAAPPILPRQVEAWMNEFFPGITLQVEPVPNANLVTLGIRTSNSTKFHRPQNVGYGISHVLPIVTACLGARQGDLIMIENPEAHLHPAGQAKMGEFLARSANADLQIILETHSDHVLNGIRKSVKNGIIDPSRVAVHFFSRRDDSENAQVMSPLINKKGNLDQWPKGFFDQMDKDTVTLIDWEN